MKVKDFKPTYDVYEVFCFSPPMMKLMNKVDADNLIGDFEITSVKDYKKTHITSIIVQRPGKQVSDG